MGFDLNKEKLRCVVVVDDEVAGKLCSHPGPAYYRGFILEDRETHRVFALYRFKYDDGERSWFRLDPKEQNGVEAMVEHLRCGVEDVLKLGLLVFGVDARLLENAITFHYPPDDEGDPMKTIVWLEGQDLAEITVEKTSQNEADA